MIRFVLQSLIHSLRANYLLHAASVLTITLCMGLLIFAFSSARILKDWTGRLDESVRILVQVQSGQADVIEKRIRLMQEVATVEPMSGSAIADSVSRVLGLDAPEALQELGLPSILRVAPQPGSGEKLIPLATSIGELQGVVSVEYGQRWLQRFHEVSGTALRGSVALALLLVGAALAILTTTYTLILYSRRREIEIMILVGASPSHIYVPVLVEGFLQAFIGAALATSIATGLLGLAASRTVVFGTELHVTTSGALIAAYITLGTLLGVVSSVLAMSQSLSRVADEDIV